jgi:hypothetical protein
MGWVWAGFLLAGVLPLAAAWRANRRTALVHAMGWATLAWLAWTATVWAEAQSGRVMPVPRYLALSLTGCAGVAVLGARRPGAAPWNFVVIGLEAVLLRPLLEGMGELRLEGPHRLFLAAALLVPALNYLPTRMGPAALALLAGCLLQAGPLLGWSGASPAIGACLVALSPWIAWLGVSWRAERSEFDRLWLSYRDRLGFLWSQRVREQFNHAAEHAGWAVRLGWRGLRATGEGHSGTEEMLATLQALLKRFGPDQ